MLMLFSFIYFVSFSFSCFAANELYLNNFFIENPSNGVDKALSILVIPGEKKYIIGEKIMEDGYNDEMFVKSFSKNFTEEWNFSELLGGTLSPWLYLFSFASSKERNMFFIGGGKYGNGGSSIFLEKYTTNGVKICAFSKDWNYADELDQISFSKKHEIIGVGRFDGSKGAVFIFDVSTCKLKAVVIHNPIYIWSSPVIKSLAEINETSAVIAQAYGEPPGKPERYSLYLCRIHLKSGKNIWCKKFSNTKEIAGPIHTSHILRVNENLYAVAVQHYPSGMFR